MTTVANCFDLNEALRLKMILESANIPVFIPDEVSAGIVPYHFINQSGVRVQVAEEHAEAAKELIENTREGQ